MELCVLTKLSTCIKERNTRRGPLAPGGARPLRKFLRPTLCEHCKEDSNYRCLNSRVDRVQSCTGGVQN